MEWQLWIVHEENEPQIPFLWGSPLLHLPQCSAARGRVCLACLCILELQRVLAGDLRLALLADGVPQG